MSKAAPASAPEPIASGGAPLVVRASDPLRRDLYFRYNQSLQEFVNASSAFRTTFAA